MTHCVNCGAEIPAGGKFCPSCGKMIGMTAPTTAIVPSVLKKSPTAAGCLAVICILVILGMIGSCASQQSSPTKSVAEYGQIHGSGSSGSNSSHFTPSIDNCHIADQREHTAADAMNAESYQKAYDLSVSGLHYVQLCSNDIDALISKGYLLTFKGASEHYLHSGDSETDLNQANTLLVECQTTPGVYGTHQAALCETQENTNIRVQTDWDMRNY
jgi:hypothetical protein